MPWTVGITGGIGSGKSLVAKLFEVFGIPCYAADDRSKALTLQPQIKNQIIHLLGEKSYTPQGEYNRKWVAEKVFGNPEILEKLNQILHPAVANDFSQWAKEHYLKPYVLKEAALLFESGSYKTLNQIVLVTAPKEIRAQRVLARDPFRSKEQVLQIIENQWSDEKKKELAQFFVNNDGNALLLPQCLAIHEAILKASKKR